MRIKARAFLCRRESFFEPQGVLVHLCSCGHWAQSLEWQALWFGWSLGFLFLNSSLQIRRMNRALKGKDRLLVYLETEGRKTT